MWNPFKKTEEVGLVFGKYEYTNPDDDDQTEKAVQGGWSETPGGELETVEKPLPRLRQTIRVLLLTLVTLVPVWFLPFATPEDMLDFPKQLLFFGVVLISLVFWLVITIRQGGLVLRRSGWEWGVLAVLGAGLLSAIFSDLVYNSFLAGGGFITLVSLVVFFFLIFNFFEKKDYPQLINFYLLGTATAVLGGLAEIMGWPIFSRMAGITGLAAGSFFNTVGSANGLGALAVLGAVFFAAYYFGLFYKKEPLSGLPQGAGKGWRIIHWIGFGSFILWIFMANWGVLYAALIAGMLGVILSLGLVARLTGQKMKLNPLDMVLPMILLVGSIMFILGGNFFDLNASRILKQPLAPEATVSQTGSWKIAKEVINKEPLWGVGEENFVTAYDLFKPVSINKTIFWTQRFNNSSSEFFNLLIEEGLIGLAALVVLLFVVWKSGFSKKDVRVLFYLWTILPVFLVSLVLFFLSAFNFVLLTSFWFLLAIMAVAVSEKEKKIKIRMDEASLSSLTASLGLVLVLILGIIGGYLLMQKYSAQTYFAQASRVAGTSREDFDQQIALLQKSLQVNKREDVYRHALAAVMLKRIDLELKNKTDKPEEVRKRLEELTRTLVQVAQQMTVQHRQNSQNWYQVGWTYENLATILSGAETAAVSAYEEYLKLSPRDPNGYFRLGTIYLTKADRSLGAIASAKSKGLPLKNEAEMFKEMASDLKNAEESFKKALELKPDLAIAVYSLGIVYERQSKVKEAIKQLEPLRTANLDNPNLAFELALLYYRDAQKDKAIAEMKRAIELFKDYSNARWYLALMYEEKGEINKAIEQLNEILRLEVNKDNLTVLQKISSLEEGKREFPPAKVTSKRPL